MKRIQLKQSSYTLCVASALFALSACNGNPEGISADMGKVLGQDEVHDPSTPTPPSDGDPTPNPGAPTGGPQVGTSCQGSGKVCVALKYVVYADNEGDAIVSEVEAAANLAEINSLYATCGVAFEIEKYAAVDPRDYGLEYNTSTMGALNSIRSTFEDDETLLVVTTGAWSGSLGAGSANAWTMMPGGGTYGAILEASVGKYANIIAHEIGHYLNLDHVSNTTNMMNPVIYSTSTALSSGQCSTVKSAINYYWSNMVR